MFVTENGLPAVAKVPASQVVQTLEVVAPTASEPEPVAHAKQDWLAEAAEYLPATHRTQGDAPGEYRPAEQVVHVLDEAPEPEPAGHTTHEVEEEASNTVE